MVPRPASVLYFFRNTAAFRRLSSDLVGNINKYSNDDQKAMNCILHKDYELVTRNILQDGSMVLTYHQDAGDDADGPDDNDAEHKLTVTLLPYSQVLRNCRKAKNVEKLSNVTVAHCLTGKKGESKMKMYSQLHLVPSDVAIHDW